MSNIKKFEWSDVTLSQFDQILSISEIKKNDLDKMIDVLSVMTGETSEYYKEMLLDDVTEQLTRISELKSDLLKPSKLNDTYIVEGIKYKLTTSAKQMTAGQFIDYQVTLHNNPKDIAMMCAIFLIPDGKKYGEEYDVMKLKETLYNSFKYVDAMAISFFFQKTLDVLSKTTLSYSIKKLKKEMKKQKDPEKLKSLEEAIQMTQETIKSISLKSGIV